VQGTGGGRGKAANIGLFVHKKIYCK